jgi:hypothetical protein
MAASTPVMMLLRIRGVCHQRLRTSSMAGNVDEWWEG